MSQLIVQADDIAISHATTLGILDAIERGIVRNTGVFANRPHAAFAAEQLNRAGAHGGVDVGLDLNFVTGRPVLPAADIPDIVRADGSFRSSHEIRRQFPIVGGTPIYPQFRDDPFDHDQTLAEARAQVQRFVELFGRMPAYLHHHALVSPTSDRVLHEVAEEHGILAVDDVLRSPSVTVLPNDWYSSPFGLDAQSAADPVAAFSELVPRIAESELSVLITHPGYLDAELLSLSSYSVIRVRDHELTTSPEAIRQLRDHGIDLVSYSRAMLGGVPLREAIRPR